PEPGRVLPPDRADERRVPGDARVRGERGAGGRGDRGERRGRGGGGAGGGPERDRGGPGVLPAVHREAARLDGGPEHRPAGAVRGAHPGGPLDRRRAVPAAAHRVPAGGGRGGAQDAEGPGSAGRAAAAAALSGTGHVVGNTS